MLMVKDLLEHPAMIKAQLVFGVPLHSEPPRIVPGSIDRDNEVSKMLDKKKWWELEMGKLPL